MYVPWDCNRVESLTRSSCPPWYGIITQSWEFQSRSRQTSWFKELPPSILSYSKRGWVTRVIYVMLHHRSAYMTYKMRKSLFRRSQCRRTIDRRKTSLTMSKSVKKLVEETKEQGYTELELCDKSLSSIADIPGLSKCTDNSWKQKKLEFSKN